MLRKLGLLALVFLMLLSASACNSSSSKSAKTIKIGINAELTGDIPKVGEATKYAAQLWLDDINKAGGITVNGTKYPVELVIEDNESKAESAAAANTKLATQDQVLLIVGPQASKQAVPAGEVANNLKTPMITPWSTNPNATKNRPWVFRAAFLDPFQGPVMAKFITEQFKFNKGAILYDVASDYPKGLAEYFKKAWEDLHGAGSIVGYESFSTKDRDFRAQLTKIKNSGAEFLFTPQYYDEVPLIIGQARELGFAKPVFGSDSWGSAELIKLAGPLVEDAYFSTHYAAAGATGKTKEFIDRYNAKYKYVPDDVAALTWDALNLAKQAIENSGGLTGKVADDRQKVRDALAKVKDFDGITGKMTFSGNGDPVKAAVIVHIKNGQFEFFKQVAP